jgi:Uma2 family endonuclease
MSAEPTETLLLTWPEYVKFEEVYEGRRHDLVRGRVRLMAGGSERHDLTTQAIYDQLRPALRGGPCHVFIQNRRIRTGEATGFYPDLLVRCGAAGDRLFETDARLVVEVLSPSNDSQDRLERLYAYRGLPGIQMIVFVDEARRIVTVHERTDAGWSEAQLSAQTLRLPWLASGSAAGEVLIDWAQVWEDVDAGATT